MPLIKWDETMSVGIAELDEQHRQLIDLINKSFEAIQRLDSKSLSVLLDRMHQYAVTHFEDEEAIMREAGFPDAEPHARQHAEYTEQVRDFRARLNDISDMPQLFVYLSRWLTNHIMVEDKKFMPYIAEEDGEKE